MGGSGARFDYVRAKIARSPLPKGHHVSAEYYCAIITCLVI